jgi:hypothetical protein
MREAAVQNWTGTEVKNIAVADLVKNYRQIASRIIAESFNTPKTVVLWMLKEDLEKMQLCASFVPHSLTPEKMEDQVRLAKVLSRWQMQTKISLTKLLWERGLGVLPMTPKQSDKVPTGLVRLPLGRRNRNSKSPASRPY